MAGIVQGIWHTLEGLVQSVVAVFQTVFDVVFSVFHTVASVAWGLVEQTASFVGASVHLIISNIVILALIAVTLVVYRRRNTRGTVANDIKKKVQ